MNTPQHIAQRSDVNPGWTPAAWADRLCQMADRCAELHPELAAAYRQWAANIRQRVAAVK